MKKVEQIIETKTKVTITCDRCNKFPAKPCIICGKDICFDCSEHIDIECDIRKPYFYSDNPDYICKECWKRVKLLGIKYKILGNKPK